ncbi:MAG: hypothetical protein QXR14_08815 [Sulfolobales archaeon]
MDLYLFVFCVGEECFYGYLADNLSGRGSLKNGEIHTLYAVLEEIRNMWKPGDSLTLITSSKTLVDFIAKDKERLMGLRVDVRWIPEYMNKARREAIYAYVENAVSRLLKIISSYVIRRVSENILRVSVNGSNAIVFLSDRSEISMSCTCLEYSDKLLRERLPLCIHIVAVANAFNSIPTLVSSISTFLMGGEG